MRVGSYGSSSGCILARHDVAGRAAIFFHAGAKGACIHINAHLREGRGQDEKNIVCKGTVVLMIIIFYSIHECCEPHIKQLFSLWVFNGMGAVATAVTLLNHVCVVLRF